MSISTRAAPPADMPLIASLIRALAEYEKLSHEVRFDEAVLAQKLFGSRPYAEVLIGEVDGEARGFALFFHNFSTFEGRPGIYLEDLFVMPEARGAVLGVVKAAESVQFSGAMARSQAELPVAQANAARLSQLAKEGVIAPSRAEEAVANLRAVQATLAENRRLLALGGASRDGTVTLRSPIAGRVASVSVETGGAVSTDGAPFVVENIAALRLDLQLPQRLAGQLRPGMPVAVEQDGRRVTGKLLSVGASLDPVTRSLVARASVAGDAGLVPGKGVTAIIEAAGETTKGVSVPRTAVANVDGKDVVFVRDGKNFRRQVVKVAGESSGRMVIGSGLDAHAQVVTKGVAELKAIFAGA